MILSNVKRFVESASSILRNNDNTNVSILFHGEIVGHELSFFHFTYSPQPSVGSSQGNSARRNSIRLENEFVFVFHFKIVIIETVIFVQ